MGDNLITSVVTVLTAIVGVAIIAVLVSNKAQTGSILTAGGNAFATAIEAAVSPVTGSSPSIGSNYGLNSPSAIQIG
jgi:acid phosphatase family membrane protein YuiD